MQLLLDASVPVRLRRSLAAYEVELKGRARTSPAVMQRLHDEALKVLGDADVTERLAKLGAEPFPLAQDAFNAFIRTEVEAAAKIARAANLKGP